MKYCFNFSDLKSYQDFYTQFRKDLPTPSYFGNNLDALSDFITGGAPLPLHIRFTRLNGFKKHAFSKLIAVMQHLDQEVEGFAFTCD